MLAAMPGVPPQAQRSVNATTLEDDRLCAGCSKSVSSDTGGVVVAFGTSLWHVNCFKCAKCDNQVNADTNLLLLSDGSPVCANCYNCKVCKKPILDEAVMTGDDSFHAECFTCRSCKNRIDELVFAKTSQGFYCMKCHNERVARSRRHIAKQKQRERERAGLGSSNGRSATAGEGGVPRPKEGEHANPTPVHPDVSRAKHASDDGSSSDSHGQAYLSSQAGSRSSHGTFGDNGVPGSSNVERSASPAPPAVSVTMAGPSSEQSAKGEISQSHAEIQAQEKRGSGESAADRRPSIDNLPPPPYSKSPPAGGNSDVESARSSASYGYNASSTEPTSPSISVSASNEDSFNDHSSAAPATQDSSTSLPYLNSGGRERSSSLTPRERPAGSTWPDAPEEHRRRSHDEGRNSFLQPSGGGMTGLNVSRRREKRNSVNPGLQLEGSKMLQYRTPKRPGTAPSTSPSDYAPAGSFARRQSPTRGQGDSPRVTSPLREYFNADESSSGSTASPLKEHQVSPRAAPVPARSQSASAAAVSTSPPSRKDVFANMFPQRSDSLKDSEPAPAFGATLASSRANGLPSSPYNGRLNTPTGLRSQRSFDERGRLSPRKADFGDATTKRSRSVSPAPPDVPRSIESGTDTETDNGNDSDDIAQKYMDMPTVEAQSPPSLPPKSATSANESTGLAASQPNSQPNSAGVIDGDDYEKTEAEGYSAVTQRTSGFFMTPALPPMRFSMSGTDFNELISNLGTSNSAKRLSMLPGMRRSEADVGDSIPEEKGEDLDVATARTPTSLTSTITPQTDITPSSENANSSLSSSSPPMFRPSQRKASLKGKRSAPPGPIAVHPAGEKIIEVSPLTSPASTSHLEGSMVHRRRSSRTEATTPRSSDESRRPMTPKISVNGINGHRRSESNGAVPRKQDSVELVTRRVKEALADATDRQADYVKLDRAFVEAIVQCLEQKREQVVDLSTKLDGMKRTSQMIFNEISVAQDEYKQELVARQTAEEEVSRLKIEVSGQAARITVLSSEERRREAQKRLEKELHESLNGLEQDLSKLKVERDMTLAEVEELSASKMATPNGDAQGANIGRSLTMRFDNIKRQYQHELVPLTQQKEALVREIADLKEARDIFLEETAVLNARNEQLAQLNQQYERRVESGHSRDKSLPPVQPPTQEKRSFDKFDSWKRGQATQVASAQPLVNTTSTSSSATLIDDAAEARQQRPSRSDANDAPARPRNILRWPGGKNNKDMLAGGLAAIDNAKGRKRVEHMFQQLSVLRFARCDLCGDKMWGSQVRCSTCNMSVHVRCVGQVHASCTHDGSAGSDDPLAPIVPPPPSMFGRDLIEQVQDDAKNLKNSELFVPIIVDKCIDAVEANALDYEGIYRKTGGSGQSKAITALFERGDYTSFNLSDSDSFNDVSSVTSVLKNYFRSLPNPLLTFGMHEAFVSAAQIKDPNAKGQALKDLVKQLPAEHYHTLSRLMLHLHKIQLKADINLMNARNLGVIFGPTLMRSADPSREFADMAGKSLAIEYLIENAPSIFPSSS